MTRSQVVAIAATTWIVSGGIALAQGARQEPGRVRMAASVDSLDPLAQSVARSVPRRSVVNTSPSPRRTSSNQDAYAVYMQEYNRYLADYARYQREQESKGPGFFEVMAGISAGLQVADQAVLVYEHAVEAKALANTYR